MFPSDQLSGPAAEPVLQPPAVARGAGLKPALARLLLSDGAELQVREDEPDGGGEGERGGSHPRPAAAGQEALLQCLEPLSFSIITVSQYVSC